MNIETYFQVEEGNGAQQQEDNIRNVFCVAAAGEWWGQWTGHLIGL